MVVGPREGSIGSPGLGVDVSDMGGVIVLTSVSMAEHLTVGLPVVPGGHVQEGRWPTVSHEALGPHRPS